MIDNRSYSQAGGLRIEAPHGDLTLAAPMGRVVIEGDEISMQARRWVSRIEEVRHTVGRWEIVAGRAVETAQDVYRTCEGLLQVRAGRMRSVVEGAYDLVAKRASIASDEETKIDGKRVVLG